MLDGTRVRLRASERDDLPRFVAWRNDPEVRRWLLMFQPISQAMEERRYEGLLSATDRYVFAIDAAEGDAWVPIGACGLEELSLREGTATLCIFLGDAGRRGQDLGEEAVRLLLAFGFGEPRLHRIELEVFPDVERAIRLYERLGFVHAGTRREARFKDGRSLDVHLMSLLEHEHRAKIAAAAG